MKNDFFFKLISRAIKDGINIQTYKRRVKILKNTYENTKKTLNNNFINIKCVFTANYIINKLFENFQSYVETIICSKCTRINSRNFPSVIANLLNDSLDYLEDTV